MWNKTRIRIRIRNIKSFKINLGFRKLIRIKYSINQTQKYNNYLIANKKKII
jgi:hypothetical protein